jgi:hypothetical protein
MATYHIVVQRNHYACFSIEADTEKEAEERCDAKLASEGGINWKVENLSPFGYNYIVFFSEDDLAADDVT